MKDPELIAGLQQELRQTLPRGQLKVTALPMVPELRLALFDPDVLQGPLSHDEAQAVVEEPAYWCFCWASGQVLARYILQHPERVCGLRVADVGSGSGVVAVAAALAGAREVVAVDIDPASRKAVAVNAALNGVNVSTAASLAETDVITAADILYDRDNLALLDQFRSHAGSVLLADSRIRNLQAAGYGYLETHDARTCPDLNEFEEFNQVRLYLAEQRAR